MQTVTIHTSQNIGIDYEIAGVGDRVLARMIDYGIFIALLIASLLVVPNLGGGDSVMLWYFATMYALFVFYDLICEVFFNGQSLGKRIMKIRVISLNGKRPTFGQYLIRWLFRIVDFVITGVVGLICAAVTQNVQRVGDLVAGTTLIRTKPRTTIDNLVYAPTVDTYEPVFKEAALLTDRDIALVNDVIQAYMKVGNAALVYNMAEKLKGHLGISIPETMNDMLFLQTIIKDYSHMVSHQADAL
ncbi:RDD family protein [Mucilaginibacter sp. UR6-1]|uniref:RDD family protein n=1 Tax=Mucilaginibacter sp. UR6-1 TaxID=1435643 RepID=UPI001E5ED0AA|nr:RDD family protein [Mucilaginibacter sp. UR6-1]MCC8408437.1 RDD family protein [Mucilaginibacter sp. UR6-1]